MMSSGFRLVKPFSSEDSSRDHRNRLRGCKIPIEPLTSNSNGYKTQKVRTNNHEMNSGNGRKPFSIVTIIGQQKIANNAQLMINSFLTVRVLDI